MLALAFMVVLVSGLGQSRLSGIDDQIAADGGAVLGEGCSCHQVLPSGNVTPVLEGLPGNYTSARGPEYEVVTYNVTVRILGGPETGRGGFNLDVTGGTLAMVGDDSGVRVTEDGDATHTQAGTAQREWNLTWTAPEEAGEAVRFRLTVNAVNGDSQATNADHWNRLVVISEGVDGAPLGRAADPVHIETLGVNWLAYWVGIASFVFLLVIMVLYFFVFKHTETSHATDHTARKKKNK